jgi:predicted nucleotidyltransferase
VNLANGIKSVIPGVHGAVLEVLGRTNEPLSGRGVAQLVGDRASTKGVYLVLRALTTEGIVTAKEHPSTIFYQLNREHLAASSIEDLAHLRERLIEAIHVEIASWPVAPYGAWIFGSFARGTAGSQSDIDVLVTRPKGAKLENEQWRKQLHDMTRKVSRWTGNDCRVAEFSQAEFLQLFSNNDRLARELHSDALSLTSRRLPVLKSTKGNAR